MKKALFVFIALIPLFAIALPNFFITGTGVALKDGDKIYLVYRQNGKVIFDSTIVRSKSFDFAKTIDEVSRAYICKNKNPMLAEILAEQTVFYTEKGHLKISCPSSLNNAIISGTKINNELQELNTKLKPYADRIRTLSKRQDALTPGQQKDINNMADFRAENKRLLDEMAPIQFRFIKNHPDSYISLVTLKQMLNNKVMLPEINNAYAGLSPDAKTSVTGKEIAAGIASSKKLETGTMAYNFTLPDTKGKPVSLTDFKGKYILVDFWASWCLPCRQENPNVILAYNKFKDKGFTVLSVSIENKNESKNWLRAIQEDHLPWTQVLDGEKQDAKVKTIYGITTIPANVLIDPTCKIIAKDLKDKVLINKLAELLGQPSDN